MKYIPSKETFREFFEAGLAGDIFQSQVHYFIYRTIAENANEVNKQVKSNERQQLVYLQDVSRDAALISLAKIFDRQHKKYRVNCLKNLLDECRLFDCNDRFPFRLEYCPELEILSEMAEVELPLDQIDSKLQLISFYDSVLDSNKVKRSLTNLMIVRDKFIAHNEYKPETNELYTFWDDFSFLRDIAKLYKTTIGQVFLGVNYSPLQKIGNNSADSAVVFQLYWVLDLLEEVLGKGKVKTWWIND